MIPMTTQCTALARVHLQRDAKAAGAITTALDKMIGTSHKGAN